MEEEDQEIVFEFSLECNYCGKPEPPSRCSRCKSELYCNKECQRLDWERGHKYICNEIVVAIGAEFPYKEELSVPKRGFRFKRMSEKEYGKYIGVKRVLDVMGHIPAYVIDYADLTPDQKGSVPSTPAGSTPLGVVMVRFSGESMVPEKALRYLSQGSFNLTRGLAGESRKLLRRSNPRRKDTFPPIPLKQLGVAPETTYRDIAPGKFPTVPPDLTRIVPKPAVVPTTTTTTTTKPTTYAKRIPKYYEGRELKLTEEKLKEIENIFKAVLKSDNGPAIADKFVEAVKELSGGKKPKVPHGKTPPAKLEAKDLAEVQKLARYGISGIEYDDYAISVNISLDALKVLYGGQKIDI